MTNIKYTGNNTSATVYNIAPVKAKPRFLMNNPKALNITASTVNTK